MENPYSNKKCQRRITARPRISTQADGSDGGALPDAPSPATAAETRKFLAQIDPALAPSTNRSVRETRDTVLKF